MAELKTKVNDKNVSGFLESIEPLQKKEDSYAILNLMKEVTKQEPKMWGDTIIGFGNYHYKYASGREGDWFVMGFSPRKQNLTIYIMNGIDQYKDMLDQIGTFKTGKSCLYIKKLEDVNMKVLRELLEKSVNMKMMGEEERRQ